MVVQANFTAQNSLSPQANSCCQSACIMFHIRALYDLLKVCIIISFTVFTLRDDGLPKKNTGIAPTPPSFTWTGNLSLFSVFHLQRGCDINVFSLDLRQIWSFAFICGFIFPTSSPFGSPSPSISVFSCPPPPPPLRLRVRLPQNHKCQGDVAQKSYCFSFKTAKLSSVINTRSSLTPRFRPEGTSYLWKITEWRFLQDNENRRET